MMGQIWSDSVTDAKDKLHWFHGKTGVIQEATQHYKEESYILNDLGHS